MTTDVVYGADVDARIGIMADASTDPSTWIPLEFLTLGVQPSRNRKQRGKLGRARHNAMDPVKPINGLFKYSTDLVIDADSRMLGQLLRMGLGAPSTSGPSSGIYTHLWDSGVKTPAYFCLQYKFLSGDPSDEPVRIFRGLTIGAISVSGTGENVQDYDVALSLRGLTRQRAAAYLSGSVSSLPTDQFGMSRAVFQVGGVTASNTLQSSWSWDRQLAEDAFMTTATALSGLRPNGGMHKGGAKFRALGEAYDDLEEDDTVFAPGIVMNGVTSGHEIRFVHQAALMDGVPQSISGPGMVERDISWEGHQTSSAAAARITIKNDFATYA